MASINILGVPCTYDLTAPTSSSSVLVFVHGWLLSRGYWQPLIDRLSSTYQCLSYDLRGFGGSRLYPRSDLSSAPSASPSSSQVLNTLSQHGQAPSPSSRPQTQTLCPPTLASLHPISMVPDFADRLADGDFQAEYTPAAYAKDLAVLLEQLNVQNVWLIGHSLGGTIALWAAHQLPQIVKGVICLNAGGGIYLKEDCERFRTAGQQILKLRPRWLCHLPMIDLLFDRSTIVHPIDRAWRRKRVIDFVAAHPEAALGSLLAATTESEINRIPLLVSDLKQPIYFLAGVQDSVMQLNDVRHLASFHPLFGTCGNNVIEIEDCGHMAMLEQPDQVTTEIQAILQQNHDPHTS